MQVGGRVSEDKDVRAARAKRFASKKLEVPMPQSARKAFADAGPNGKWVVSNRDEALFKLLTRKLANGEKLTPAQIAAAPSVGITVQTSQQQVSTENQENIAMGDHQRLNAQQNRPRQQQQQQQQQQRQQHQRQRQQQKQRQRQQQKQQQKQKHPQKQRQPPESERLSRDTVSQLHEVEVAAMESSVSAAGNQKKLRKALKLLRQIEQLQASAEAGQLLNTQQQDKLDRRAEIEAEIARCS